MCHCDRTQFELWLSLMRPTPSGLCAAEQGFERAVLMPIHSRRKHSIPLFRNIAQMSSRVGLVAGAKTQPIKEMLLNLWRGASSEQAYKILGAPDVRVTNQSDKDMQLVKITQLDDKCKLYVTTS